MALQNFDGGFNVPIGFPAISASTITTVTLDAANEAAIFIGRIVTSDGDSHTIDTTGSSALAWQTTGVTFANGSTVVKVGLAPVLATAGPPGRAANAADVISFDLSKSLTGGAGGITGSAWQSHVPDTGTKTIANGDLIAFAVQMITRGGVDSVTVTPAVTVLTTHRPLVTGFTGGAYAAVLAAPNAVITFSDGALGYFHMSEVFSTISSRTFNSGSSPNEYGQLFKLPFPAKIVGAYGYIDPDADCDVVLYSDPLGTPVAEKTISLDANTVQSANSARFYELFPSAYTTAANQNIAMVFKPGGTNVSVRFKALASATHRIADPWGTDGYGISRASGAFANANSSLDHYYIGLIVGAFEHGVWPSYGMGI